jgi:hypothetical protein
MLETAAGGAELRPGLEGEADQALDRAGSVVVGLDAEAVPGAVPEVGGLDDRVHDRAGPVAPGPGLGAYRVRGQRTNRAASGGGSLVLRRTLAGFGRGASYQA